MNEIKNSVKDVKDNGFVNGLDKDGGCIAGQVQLASRLAAEGKKKKKPKSSKKKKKKKKGGCKRKTV